jgi:hypothetical protein
MYNKIDAVYILLRISDLIRHHQIWEDRSTVTGYHWASNQAVANLTSMTIGLGRSFTAPKSPCSQ